MTCEQIDARGARCTEQGAYRFLWPGFLEQKICEAHALKARAVADTMSIKLHDAEPVGLYVPGEVAYLIPIERAPEPDLLADKAIRARIALDQAFRRRFGGRF